MKLLFGTSNASTVLARCVILVPLFAGSTHAGAVLGTAADFAVLGGSTVTNTGSTVLYGSLGVSPGSAITGFPPGVLSGGSIHAGDALAAGAQNDLTTAYGTLSGMPFTTDLTGQDLGGMILTPGVYRFSSSAQLTGTLILDALHLADARFVFQIGSTLTTASNSSVVEINGVQAANQIDGVYFQVGSSATLGTATHFAGNIVALTSITLNTGATIDCGRALARNGAVTLDTNNISIGSANTCGAGEGFAAGASAVPEPSTLAFTSLGLVCCLAFVKRKVLKTQREQS